MLFVYLLAIIGLCRIIVDSTIFEPLKLKFQKYSTIYYMLNCYQCSGFWSGIIVGLLICLSKIIPDYDTCFILLIYGLAGSSVCVLFNDVIELIRECNTYLMKK